MQMGITHPQLWQSNMFYFRLQMAIVFRSRGLINDRAVDTKDDNQKHPHRAKDVSGQYNRYPTLIKTQLIDTNTRFANRFQDNMIGPISNIRHSTGMPPFFVNMARGFKF